MSRDDVMAQVKARAKELGQATAFGNKEVAQGMTELISRYFFKRCIGRC